LLRDFDDTVPSVKIRPVGPHDAAAWAAMRARLWPDADAAEMQREADAFVGGGRQAMLEAVYLAEDDSARTLGFIELSIRAFADGCESRPVPHVEGWYVEPAARRSGIARALLSAAEDWARALGFTELASDTEVENVASQHAHARCGFAETERLVKFRKRLR
jgi:aminoglycoside 6'-N-acetyltransferase I